MAAKLFLLRPERSETGRVIKGYFSGPAPRVRMAYRDNLNGREVGLREVVARIFKAELKKAFGIVETKSPAPRATNVVPFPSSRNSK